MPTKKRITPKARLAAKPFSRNAKPAKSKKVVVGRNRPTVALVAQLRAESEEHASVRSTQVSMILDRDAQIKDLSKQNAGLINRIDEIEKSEKALASMYAELKKRGDALAIAGDKFLRVSTEEVNQLDSEILRLKAENAQLRQSAGSLISSLDQAGYIVTGKLLKAEAELADLREELYDARLEVAQEYARASVAEIRLAEANRR